MLNKKELLGELDENIFQTNSPNCFMVTGLNILKNIPGILELLESSLEILENGTYNVKIPFIGQGQIINITEKDLGIKYNKEGKIYNKINFPIRGPKLIQILEAVYTKVLLENNRVIDEKGGRPTNILKLFLGEQYLKDKFVIKLKESFNKNYNKSLSNLSIFLNNIDYKKNIIYINGNNHYYNVKKIDKERQEIHLLDPFTTDKEDIYKYSDLIKFNNLYCLNIDISKTNEVISMVNNKLFFVLNIV